ncbi:MAG: SAM-dependent methyltransferase [Candidatus Nanopelagicales bacterium]
MNKLYLLGNQIGNWSDVPPRTIEMLENASLVVCEWQIVFDKLVQELGITISAECVELERDQDNADEFYSLVEEHLGLGDVVLITDAGYPMIADVGWFLGRHVLSKGYEVSIIAGPSIATTAQAVSFFSSFYENFIWLELFQYDENTKKEKLYELIELPYNIVLADTVANTQSTAELLGNIFGSREANLIFNLTMPTEKIIRTTADNLAKEYEAILCEHPDDVEKHLVTIVIAGA